MTAPGYLQMHENPNSRVRADGKRYWGYPSRRARVQIIGIHTAETAPTSRSAEAVARYFTHSDRAASYHEVGDSNSVVTCLPPDATAFGAVGWNSNGWHYSFATKARLWGNDPAWDDAALRIGAKRCRIHADRFGIPYRRITLAQAERGAHGFIDHGRLDSGRRSDPGEAFPWGRFLALVENAGKPPDPWETFMAELSEDQREVLEDFSEYLAQQKVSGSSFAYQLLKLHRRYHGKVADLFDNLKLMGSTPRGFARHGVAAIRVARENGFTEDMDEIVAERTESA